jgi:membrane protein
MALVLGALFFISNAANFIVQLVAGGGIGFLGPGFAHWEEDLPSQIFRIIPWITTFGIFLLIYKYVPNRKTCWRYVWPGALAGAFLFEVGKSLFVWYLQTFASYGQVYGNLASVIVLLFWAYLSALLLILGAEISSEYERLYRPSLGGWKPGASNPGFTIRG